MNRQKLYLSTGVIAVIILGAVGYHRYQRNRILARQRSQTDAGIVPVTLATVEKRPFHGTIPFTGTLLAVNRAELRAEVSGRVTRVSVQEGDRVAAGTVLSGNRLHGHVPSGRSAPLVVNDHAAAIRAARK